MGQMIRGLFKLSRPLSTLTGVLAVALGGYVAGTGEWGMIARSALATLFVSASSNAWNDYSDIEIDRINQPQRPRPSGMVRRGRRWSFHRPGGAVDHRCRVDQSGGADHRHCLQRPALYLLGVAEEHGAAGQHDCGPHLGHESGVRWRSRG
jgi:hypothetical protein